jgi:predicted site-specific integrase-resolvase
MTINTSEINKPFYKPKDIKELLNVSLGTVQNMTNDGRLIAIRNAKNRRMITRDSVIAYLDNVGLLFSDNDRIDVIYARVSTHKQKQRGDLERQIQSLKDFAITKNPKSLEEITDVASGLNDNRKGLNKIINMVQSDKVDRVFVSYKDRLTRFGFNYLKAICDHHNTEIIMVSSETVTKSTSEELAEDIISIIHSFSGEMYGLRSTIKQRIEDK